MNDDPGWRTRTKLVHSGGVRSSFGETSEALYLTSSYVYDNAEQAEARFKQTEKGFVYSRFGNPTVRMFEERMIALEGASDACATATGMAAVTSSLLASLRMGDHVVASRALFASCRYVLEELLPRYGIACDLVDGGDLAQWQAAMKSNTKILFLETPSNPRLEILDIAAIADIAHQYGAKLIVDNVFATPILQHPFKLGADIVVYSATKHIDGQGRCLGGIVLGTQDFIDELAMFNRQTGPSLSPFNAWVLVKALETLELRVNAHCDNASQFADYLQAHKKVANLMFPGHPSHPQYELACRQMTRGGNLIAFDIVGDKQTTFTFINALKLIKISNNLGDAKTLITHPATTTHQRLNASAQAQLGISDTGVRISIGLEDVVDLIADFEQAFATI